MKNLMAKIKLVISILTEDSVELTKYSNAKPRDSFIRKVTKDEKLYNLAENLGVKMDWQIVPTNEPSPTPVEPSPTPVEPSPTPVEPSPTPVEPTPTPTPKPVPVPLTHKGKIDMPESIKKELYRKSYERKNYIDWEAFPDEKLTADVWVGYGQLPQFTNDKNGNSSTAGLPIPIAKGFKNVGDTESYGLGNRGMKYVEVASCVPNEDQKTKIGYAMGAGVGYVTQNEGAGERIGTYLWDNEGDGLHEYWFNANAARGAINHCLSVGNDNFVWLDYQGLDLAQHTLMSNYYYSGGDRLKWKFPSYDTSIENQYTTINSKLIFEGLDYKNHNYRRTLPIYLTAGLPDSVSLYKKNGGKYVLDSLGDRLPNFIDIHSNLRGEDFKLSNYGDRDSDGLLKLCSNGFSKDGSCIEKESSELLHYVKHQSMDAINSISSQVVLMTNYLIARNRKQFGTTDITKFRPDATWLYTPIFSFRTETHPWGSATWQGQPISVIQQNATFFAAIVLHRQFQFWNGHGNLKAKEMGESIRFQNPYNAKFGDYNLDLSQVANATAGINYCNFLNRDYNFFTDSDNILMFQKPSEVQNGEIVAYGLLNGNNVVIFLCETRLDIDETMEVVISNKKNDFILRETVKARDLSIVLTTLPNGNYESKDIIISYTSVKDKDANTGVIKSLSGDLENHFA